MNGLMLANQDAFNAWMERAKPMADLRASRALATAPSSMLDDSTWWQDIRSRAEGTEFERHGNVARINCIGPLAYKYSLYSWYYDASCYMGISAKFRAATEDSGIEKIVLYVDSPGGNHHGLGEASDAIFAARSAGKEVVAVVDPEAASAGYWLASQANRIVGLESGWVGSVGSQIFLYSEKKMFDEMGVDIEVIRAAISPNKNLGIPYETISESARAERQSWVDAAGEQFIAHVERGRGLSREKILKDFGQGSMYFMPEAIKRGMVDAIGSLTVELGESNSSPSSRVRNRRVGSSRMPIDRF